MTDLPYTYKDSGGSELRIGRGYCTASDRTNHKTVSVDTPTGEDAVDLARAVLAAAGLRGHEVVSQKDLLDQMRAGAGIGAEEAARSMRKRAAQEVVFEPHRVPMAISDAILALPLLPGADDTAPASDMWARLKSEIPRLYGRDRAEDLPHDSEYVTALHDVLVAMKRIEHGNPLVADTDDVATEPADDQVAVWLKAHYDAADDWTPTKATIGNLLNEYRTHIATGHEQRLAALEQQFTDLANLVHGHGEDIVRLNQAGVDVSADVSRMLKATRKARRYGAGEDG